MGGGLAGEPASAESEPAATESEKKPGGGSTLSLVLAIIALIAVGAASFFAYQHWLQLKSDLAALDARLREAQSQQQQLGQMLDGASEAVRAQETALGEQRELLSRQQAAMDEARANFQQQEQQLAEENVNLQEREAELRAAVADVHRRVSRNACSLLLSTSSALSSES